jgi:hypothetical protein
MELPPDIEVVTIGTTFAVFYLIWVALIATWIFQIILRPSNRQEWAEFGKITAFLMVMTRTVYSVVSGNNLITQPWALIFWVIVGVLVGFYLYVILSIWGVIIADAFCFWCKGNRAQSIVGLIILGAVVWLMWYALYRL